MKISAMWYGGYGYSNPEQDDIEHFNSIKEAREVFINRYNNTDLKTPCVSDNTEMWISKSVTDWFEYPDIILKLGKRGGVIIQRGIEA